MFSRLWTYQKERFPVVKHGAMVTVFCLAVMLFSSMQHGETPPWFQVVAAAVSTLILFFQLRVADEYKDYATDSKYRPLRAVPRGLVSLSELGFVAGLGAIVQFVLAISIDIGLVPILMMTWGYVALMTKEFFVAKWLSENPGAYLLSHMLVMPIIAFYAGAFDWLVESRGLPLGLHWLLLLSFACGLILEIGRKVKTPDTERLGVETYSGHWGLKRALAAWTFSSAIAIGAYLAAAPALHPNAYFLSIVVSMGVLCVIAAVLVPVLRASSQSAQLIESGSGMIAMLLYLAIGPLALFTI